MRHTASPGFFAGLPPTQRVTKMLMWALGLVSTIGALMDRKLGLGATDLVFSVEKVLEGEIWRVLTYPFVERQPFGLVISLVVLWIFGRVFEHQWGSRDFQRFYFVCAVGAGVLAIPLSFVLNAIMPWSDIAVAEGPGPCFDAMLVALALTAPKGNVLFGFVLPIRATTLVYAILAFEVLVGIQTGANNLAVKLGGMLMGYLLITGNWQPTRWFRKMQSKQRNSPRLYVVPPKDDVLH